MGADIENRLLAQANCASPPEDELLREAAAEIGRLRGEVKKLAAAVPAVNDPSAHKWDADGERCVKCGDKDWMGGPCTATPAPAMPNGVEDIDWPFTYIVPDSKHEYVPKHHAERKIRDALRAADNRDAAGVWIRANLPESLHSMSTVEVMQLLLDGGIAAEQDLIHAEATPAPVQAAPQEGEAGIDYDEHPFACPFYRGNPCECGQDQHIRFADKGRQDAAIAAAMTAALQHRGDSQEVGRG